jgi:VanZ family protein
MTANRIARVSGWLLVLAAVFLTLAPRTFRPQTGVEHHLEHVLAFALLGLAFGLGYPGRRLLLALLGVAMAALLEILQSWAPPLISLLHDEERNGFMMKSGTDQDCRCTISDDDLQRR